MLKSWLRCLQRQTIAFVPAVTCAEGRRNLMTIAIETSCDDTSVAILCRQKAEFCNLLFHEKVTADNSAFRGIHPIVSLESHQESLATLVEKALQSLPRHQNGDFNGRRKPDFISVTRGPGMRSSLATGLDFAKGLAVAYQIPLVGVNHMQAHALTPRLVSVLDDPAQEPQPAFPFLSLLVSGGHTLLVQSKAIAEHVILATTTDIAIGDAVDKIARLVLPAKFLDEGGETMYGRLLERFAFPNGRSDHDYTAPTSRKQEISRKPSHWGWALVPPLAETRSGSKSKAMEFTFSGLVSAVERICKAKPGMCTEERIDLARDSMRVAFEHLASRVGWALRDLPERNSEHRFTINNKVIGENKRLSTLVVSGGVASNEFLKTVLRGFLAARGFPDIDLVYPPVELCTDNAAMIAWTGMEMFEHGWKSDLQCRALRKWSIDPNSADGGILGASHWVARTTS